MIRPSSTDRRTALLLAVVVVTGTIAFALAAPLVAADHREDDDETFLDESVSDSGSAIAERMAKWSGSFARSYATWRTDDDELENASVWADRTQAAFNERNASIERWANDRFGGHTSRDVVAVRFTDKDGGEEVIYLTANVSNGKYQNLTAVDNTSREVDYTFEFDWYLSKNAEAELIDWHEEFVEPEENLSRSYKAKMVAKYGDSVESDLWGDNVEQPA